MNPISNYYLLHINTLDGCSMDTSFSKLIDQNWLCEDCRFPLPKTQSTDVVLECKGPSNRSPFNLVVGYWIRLVKKDFLLQWDKKLIERDLFIGKVFLENNKLLDNWVTCRGKNRLILRGSKNVSYRRCKLCNFSIYFSQPPYYLYPSPPPGIDIFESHMSTLIVTEPLVEKIDRKKFRLSITKLPVLDTPKDGFTELISVY